MPGSGTTQYTTSAAPARNAARTTFAGVTPLRRTTGPQVVVRIDVDEHAAPLLCVPWCQSQRRTPDWQRLVVRLQRGNPMVRPKDRLHRAAHAGDRQGKRNREAAHEIRLNQRRETNEVAYAAPRDCPNRGQGRFTSGQTPRGPRGARCGWRIRGADVLRIQQVHPSEWGRRDRVSVIRRHDPGIAVVVRNG